jgi:tight adherence protein B
VYLIYGLVAASAVLVVEAVYLLFFSGTSYRKKINRRLQVMSSSPDREAILVQLRRERGLTGGGDYRLPLVAFNRLILQSGLTLGVYKLVVFVAFGMMATFAALTFVHDNIGEALLITIGCGLGMPLMMLRMMKSKRQKAFGAQFADALDMIVRSLRAGHPVPIAIAMVSREMKDPIGSEFGIVSDEITYGADLETAMRNLYFRVGQEDLPLFVTAVSIQGSTGGNLSEILENLSRVIRERFKMRRKIKALAAEGKFSALFLSGLPIAIFFLLNLVAPDFYASVWNQGLTKMGLGIAGSWMIFGNVVMYKMCNFRI